MSGSDGDAATRAAHWQLSSEAAVQYELGLVPVLFGPWAARLVASAPPAAGSQVLDLACGTGAVARSVAEKIGPHGAATGVDCSAEMLAVAECVTAGVQVHLQWRCCPADDMPFADGTFDAVLCQHGFQFFSDRAAAARECARVLRSGGTLAASVWAGADRNPLAGALIRALGQHAPEPVAAAMQTPFSLNDGQTLAATLSESGFCIARAEDVTLPLHAPCPVMFLRALLDAAPFAAELARRERDAVVQDVLASLATYSDGDGLRVPSVAHIIVAVRG